VRFRYAESSAYLLDLSASRVVAYTGDLTSQLNESIGIAGAGRVAQALGRLLFEAGHPVICVADRNLARSDAAAAFIGPGVEAVTYERCSGVTRWLIAVSDEAVPRVAALLAERGFAEIALHTCGAKGPEALAAMRARGTACGAIHPLQTVAAGMDGVAAMRGAAFAIWGDPEAVAWAGKIATAADGSVLRIPPELRPYYHAAAVTASNYVLALLDTAQLLMGYAGVEREDALRALAPLVRTTVSNGLERGPVPALTGPIERGDRETIASHLQALAAVPERIGALYRAAGLQTLDMARRSGLPFGLAQDMERILSGHE